MTMKAKGNLGQSYWGKYQLLHNTTQDAELMWATKTMPYQITTKTADQLFLMVKNFLWEYPYKNGLYWVYTTRLSGTLKGQEGACR